MDAFDDDALIYATAPDHPLDRRVRHLFPTEAATTAGADRFITNNSSDFPKTITEIEITYPDDLPET